MNILLDTLNLVRYNEENHRLLLENFEKGESASDFIHQIGQRLESSKTNLKTVFQSAFVVEDNNTPVGYLYISSMQKDEVFIEYAVLKEYRGNGYGKKIVEEVSDYLFSFHNIENVKLDISPNNKNSIFVAESCGFEMDEEEFESRNFSGKMVFFKQSDCYIPKRRK
jgi:RimJ/RimL family protein N-acetyltransferase